MESPALTARLLHSVLHDISPDALVVINVGGVLYHARVETQGSHVQVVLRQRGEVEDG